MSRSHTPSHTPTHTPAPTHTPTNTPAPTPTHTPPRSPEPEQRPSHPGSPTHPAEPAGGRAPGQHPGEDPAPGGEPDPGADPRESWLKSFAKTTGTAAGEAAAQKVGDKAGEWAGGKIFGSSDEAAKGGAAGSPGEGSPGEGSPGEGSPGEGFTGMGAGSGEAGGSALGGGIGAVAGATVGSYPGRMPSGMGGLGGGVMQSGSQAYAWAQASPPAPMAPIQDASHPSRGGLGGMLDEAVQYALEKSGLMDMLEKVTGDLAELNAAAQEWQAQAKAVQMLAEELRAGAQPLAGQWDGSASDAFGRHMGEVVEALDSTADGMFQTAQIVSQCAQECALAEGMIVEIISEAIEALIASLAAEAVIAVFTAGIGLIADALITEGEIAIFVARVARVSTKLAETLEKLLKALKELGASVKAVRNVNSARTAIADFKKVKTAAQGLRDFEQGGDGLGKLGKDAWQNRSLSGVGDGLKDYAVRKGVAKADSYLTGKAQDGFKSALGIGDDDPVQTGDLSVGGLGKAAGKSAWSAAKAGLTDDTNVSAVKGELSHDLGLANDPTPYRVDKSRIESAFG